VQAITQPGLALEGACFDLSEGASRQINRPRLSVLLIRQRSRDANKARVDMGDLILQALDDEVRIQGPDHRSASRTLQHWNCSLLAKRRDEATLKGVSGTFRTG
jgi:hypothetical protein